MSIMETIEKVGVGQAILELVEAIKQKDSTIAKLENEVASWKAKYETVLLANKPVENIVINTTAPVTENKVRKQRVVKTELNIKNAAKKILSKKMMHLYTVAVKGSQALVTDNKTFLTWAVDCPDGYYSADTFIESGALVPDTMAYKRNVECIAVNPENQIIGFNGEAFYNIAQSASEDETRYFMNGVYVDHINNKLVATNGRVLAMVDTKIDGTKSVIVPAKNKEPITKAHTCKYSDKYTVFYGSNYQYMVRNIDGQFPNYSRVVPNYADNDIKVLVNVPDDIMMKSIEGAESDMWTKKGIKNYNRMLSVDNAGIASMKFDTKGSPRDKEYRSETVNFNGGFRVCNTEIALNYDYLIASKLYGIETLKGIDSRKTIIGSNGEYTYLFMPMDRD